MISLTPALSGQAAPSFDHPLEMLRACHGKILRQCDTLNKMPEHLVNKGCDAQIQQAAQGILRYFDTAGQFHHQDEEEDLFPVLRTITGMNTALLDRLLAEHIVMLSAWTALRPTLQQLAEGNETTLPDTLTYPFITAYTDHIAIENGELLPMAEQLLNQQQLIKLGRKMAERRGVKFPELENSQIKS